MTKLQAATERLREHRRVITAMRHPSESPYTYIEVSTGAAGFVPEAELKDMATVVTAWLADHPADEAEPLTEEYLRAVGFEFVPGKEPGQVGGHVIELGRTEVDDAAGQIRLIEMLDGVFVPEIRMPVTDWSESVGGKACETRGDLRRLCAALGIQLKEKNT